MVLFIAVLDIHFSNFSFNDDFWKLQIRLKDYDKFDFHGAQELAAMFEFYVNGISVRDVKITKKLYPDLKSFDAWLEDNHGVIDDIIKNTESEKGNNNIT